ncbi:VOC family protein [Hymenobacter convexus]|uniref:VOC family protein n=1 Tax=Hymenobacter sp. CA1UV-4 TaxID=3063782 RepID=UPI0027128903|nr:VOC family protein [Hymenobacter sp. CA1UV-4]MDO7853827.1 VOC family protein [Hymenobacter sp. CA1UV-4]
MILNHLNLAVSDVPQTQAFFEKYFGLQAVTKSNDALVVLRDAAGMVLTLSNFDRAAEVRYPEHFHIGFVQASPDQVNELYQRLTADGFTIDPPRKFHGSWTFYLRAPGGIMVEILADM